MQGGVYPGLGRKVPWVEGWHPLCWELGKASETEPGFSTEPAYLRPTGLHACH